jgi:putative membrane protein
LTPPRRARIAGLAFLLLGAALTAWLILRTGPGAIGALLHRIGFGVVAVAAAHVVPLAFMAIAWGRLLSASGHGQPFLRLLWLRTLASAINTLLPVAQIGGEVVRAHRVSLAGVPLPLAAASVVVDLTLEFVALVAYLLLGAVLVLRLGGVSHDALGDLALALAGALGLLALAVTLQRGGTLGRLVRRIARLAGGARSEHLAGQVDQLERDARALYENRRAAFATTAWEFLGWLPGGAEVWLTLQLLGHPTPILHAIAIDAIGQAFRNAAFFVPANLGTQEAGYLAGGFVVALPPDVSLTVALVKRVRDLILFVPPLLAWQATRVTPRHRIE